MIDATNQPQLLGPDGIQRRMQEIRARMAAILDETKSKERTFADHLQGAIGEQRPWNPFAPGVKVAGTQADPALQGMITQAANQAGLDPSLLDSVVAAESGYNANARSNAGAMGLTQLMPTTAAEFGVANPFDPEQNLLGGARYLRTLMDKYGDVSKAVAAFNAGPGAVERYGGVPPYAETQNYVRKVLDRYEKGGKP